VTLSDPAKSVTNARAINWSHVLRTVIGPAATVIVFIAAMLVLRHSIHEITLKDVLIQWRTLPVTAVLIAIALTALNYTLITLYDVLALRYAGATLMYRQVMPTSFSAFAIGHNLGIPSLSGGSIRYRAYSMAGLSAIQIATVIGFVSLTFGLGATLLIGVSLLLEPNTTLANLELPPPLLRLIGAALVAVPSLYLLWSRFGTKPLRFGNWTLPIPTPRLAAAQLMLAAIDLSLLAAVLYVLLPTELGIGYWRLLGAFLLAIGAGAVSNVPGGLGVFESVLLLLLPNISTAPLLGAVLAFRLIYYVAPLTVALVLIVAQALTIHGGRLRQVTRVGGGWLRSMAPQAVGMAVFLSGTALIVGGSLPFAAERLGFVPLTVLELSHIVSSAIGAAMLILSRGLFLRLRGAYQATIALMFAAFLLAFSNGLRLEHALILALAMLVLWSARSEFYRGAKLLDQMFSVGWILSIGLVILGAVILGLFAYRHVEYSNDLWWQFAVDGDAPRMLRASLMAAVISALFGLARLVRPKPRDIQIGTQADIEHVKQIVAASSRTVANVALLGDKRFLFHPAGDAFIMFQISGRSWIALAGPIGNPERNEELAWQFREEADRHDARCVFYQVSNAELRLYVDLGLSLAKLGEVARVRLADFSIDGSSRAELRHARNRAHREGATFEIIPAPDVPGILDQLKGVSDAWLTDKQVHEKSFSLGSFLPEYLANFDCAVVRVGGAIVAFATIWKSGDGEEMSVDLMRFSSAAPKVVMDYLFTELMLWAQAQGFRWFNLGMAPLAGLEQHALATLWHKLGNLLFRFGDNFYNFEGLRRYKSKFLPEWEPRYLACPGGLLNLPRVLIDTTVLISGGVREVFTK
jgi:phosphatidylglycerol lysyltransferase